jgi:hypothetical protein
MTFIELLDKHLGDIGFFVFIIAAGYWYYKITKAEKTCEYWACDEPEKLIYELPNEAVEGFLENYIMSDMPKKILLQGYTHPEVRYDGEVLDVILENLDEEYGDPDGDMTEPNEEMKAAEKTFLEVVCKNYKPYIAESVYMEEIDVMLWIEEHKPDWLKKNAEETTKT